MDDEEAASKTKNVTYTLSNCEDTQSSSNKRTVPYNRTDYIQKAKVTKVVPPKPAHDPLHFVQLKPCNLVQTAQEQIKKAGNVKKNQVKNKEESEEWQCNLDSWKSTRRKRVEHIIDRVAEVKKIELQEHDKNRKKSKTFNEMMEQRGSRRLLIYTCEDNNDLTELGLGSLGRNSISSKNDEYTITDKNNGSNSAINQANSTEYNEYIEAIEGYKSRVLRGGNINSTTENETTSIGNKISKFDENECSEKNLHSSELASNVRKVDFFKTKELFEKKQDGGDEIKRKSSDVVTTASIKERLAFLELRQSQDVSNKNVRNSLPILDTTFSDLKNKLNVFERETKNMENEKPNMLVHYESNDSVINFEILSTRFNKPSKKNLHLFGNLSLEDSEYHIFTQNDSSEIHNIDHSDTDKKKRGKVHATDVSCSAFDVGDHNKNVEQQVEDNEANRKPQIDNNQYFESLPSRKSNDKHLAGAENINSDKDLTINKTIRKQSELNIRADKVEPHYQMPKSYEPYYEIPKNKSIPLYENVDIIRAITINNETADFTVTRYNDQDPPKEKLPASHVDITLDKKGDSNNFKRINSTKNNDILNSRLSNSLESHNMINDQISCTPKYITCFDGLQNKTDENINSSRTRSCSDKDVIRKINKVQKRLHQNSDIRTVKPSGAKQLVAANPCEDQKPTLFNHVLDSDENPDNPLQGSITAGANHWMIDNEFLKQVESHSIPPSISPTKALRSQQCNMNGELQNDLPNNPNHRSEQIRSYHSKHNIYDETLHENIRFSKSLLALAAGIEIPPGGQIPKTFNERALQYGALNTNEFEFDTFNIEKRVLQQHSQSECPPLGNCYPICKPSSSNNRHCLIQEAEQDRIDQQENASSSIYFHHSSRKTLPDSVIQTITQRVQILGIGTGRRCSVENSSTNGKRELTSESFVNLSSPQSINHNGNEDKILSVSGKKKCSHCNSELGRGAAMVIESLRLLYHLKCFKCFVCHTPLSDGFNGTDVRVRKYKLHCQNCFSSEDGIKFSCV